MADPLGVTKIEMITPGKDAVVVLERVQKGSQPAYCVHGKTQCIFCEHWVWLGDKTVEVVRSGQAAPLCLDCANTYLHPKTPKKGKVKDHLRSEGEH